MKIFNTLTRSKEEFKPINKDIINMYVCGPTVYDLFHIGNARTFIFFDCVRRYLEYKGYSVNFIQNFTDIDDKIINKSLQENKTIYEISDKYIEEYYIDSDSLNIKRATQNPRATDYLNEIIELISELMDNRFAYEIDGNVYFSIREFRSYGKLFGQDLNTLKSGSRIKINENKKDALDFILWKKNKGEEPGYNSPWGVGRPGWHTECCSMIYKYFDGNTIDIHGGGMDLIFPHHENEIAQIEALGNKKLANYWMHCSFLNMNNEKMSKSLGNFLTVREVLNVYNPNVIRFFLLSVHYRNNISFSNLHMESAKKSLARIKKSYVNLINIKSCNNADSDNYLDEIKKYYAKFINKMEDDFNTSDAISVIFEFIKYINRFANSFNRLEVMESIKIFKNFFDIFGLEYDDNNVDCKNLEDDIKDMVIQRLEFKQKRQFDKSDIIRSELEKKGYILEDIKGGTRILDTNDNNLIYTVLL